MLNDADPTDNFYPSVRSAYRNMVIPEGLPGLYGIERPSVNIRITIEDGLMYLKWGDAGISQLLYPEGGSVFSTLNGGIGLRFILDDSGLCTGVDIESMGSDLNGSHARKLE